MIASSLGQPNFYIYFDLGTKTNLTQIIGTIVSLLTVGGIFGVVGGSYLQGKIGRKPGLAILALFHLLGTGLSAGAVNVTMFIMARFVLGIGAWGLGTRTRYNRLFTRDRPRFEKRVSRGSNRGSYKQRMFSRIMGRCWLLHIARFLELENPSCYPSLVNHRRSRDVSFCS